MDSLVVIRKVLVANRGEIAIRIFRTLHEMGIRAVAVYPETDKDGMHVKHADESYQISSYLDADEILQVAKNVGADAIHPGYGFLSERTSLSSACEKSGIVFIGPRTETIRTMGDKLASKAVMRDAGVATVPSWDADPPAAEYPVLVKAVGGGGGKGMRLVERPQGLADAVHAASREAGKAFGDERVFIEKYIQHPRHIEFQVLGDAHGNVVHVFERECSIQRRHQKIIEETPSPFLTSTLRGQMADAAVSAARAVDYVGAGTVEFIVDPDGRFYFLEMNTRLQVEHPITEMTTSLDLVREQIRIAEGASISFGQDDLRQTGHSLECRIYAEVPEQHFRPATGKITVLRTPTGPGIRLDSGIEEGSLVGIHFDPILAKLVVWSNRRQQSIERMKLALDEFVLLGVENNIEFLRRVISSQGFQMGAVDTHFLDARPELFTAPSEEIPEEVLLAASVHQSSASNQSFTDPWTSSAWRDSKNSSSVARVVERTSQGGRIEVNRHSLPYYIHNDRNELIVWFKGRTYRIERTEKRRAANSFSDSLSGEVTALMPGKILRIEVKEGEQVIEKQPVIIMESMKMESTLVASKGGQICQIRCYVGQIVDMGEVLMTIA
jgi:acetyl/propionyl-CoA carboxylase alpha subunit